MDDQPMILQQPPSIEGWSRELCPACARRFMFYCPFCCDLLAAPLSVPKVALPVDVDIIFHDNRQKSTAMHAKILAGSAVRICEYPNDVPAYAPGTAVVLYPAADATPIAKLSADVLKDVTRVILIDSAWKKSKTIIEDTRLKHLQRVSLSSPPSKSMFWRYHGAGDGCISSIEGGDSLRCFELPLSNLIHRVERYV
jgi:DTW domain-containing protein YfiP